MSELINNTSKRSDVRWHLLVTVSALALASLISASAFATDDEHPTVWIEVGGQLERLSNGQENFTPPFVSTLLENPFTSPMDVQKPPSHSFGEEGSISFTPNGSNWIFLAAVRYGRSNSSGSAHEQTVPRSPHLIISIPVLGIHGSQYRYAVAQRFADTASRTHDTHLVLDFQAGKDVGLGVFGSHGSSTINAGVRFAQFTSKSSARVDSDPNFSISYKYITSYAGFPAYVKFPQQNWDLYAGKITRSHSFSGIGPSLAWDGDALLVGNPDSGSVTFDWGLSGALLFGRQKMSAHHTTMAHHGSAQNSHGPLPTVYPTKVYNTARSRSVLIPNIGGFAGISLRFPNAKVSLGYRIDAFFGAMDGGIDARKTYDRNFYGPFATISIGLGG